MVLVPRWSVGVPVDDARITVLAQDGFDRTGVDIHELRRFAFLFEFARPAQNFCLLPT
jgi:hypothetical protein